MRMPVIQESPGTDERELDGETAHLVTGTLMLVESQFCGHQRHRSATSI